MPIMKVDIPMEKWERLAEIAVQQRRPVAWQAEVILIAAIDAWPTAKKTPELATAEVSPDAA
jgi:hypothetical protein